MGCGRTGGGRHLDLLQVLVTQVLQGVNEVLLDLYVQRILHLCQALHGLPRIQQGIPCSRVGSGGEAVIGGQGLGAQATPNF